MTAPAPPAPLDPPAIAALQTALATEHAAVWAYGLVGALLPPERGDQVAEAAAAHRARRDATERLLARAGAEPVPTEAAYRTPQPVTGPAGALDLAITAETDTAAVWRSVIERSNDARMRAAALDALVGAAVRASRWRAVAGASPLTVAFPGAP